MNALTGFIGTTEAVPCYKALKTRLPIESFPQLASSMLAPPRVTGYTHSEQFDVVYSSSIAPQLKCISRDYFGGTRPQIHQQNR